MISGIVEWRRIVVFMIQMSSVAQLPAYWLQQLQRRVGPSEADMRPTSSSRSSKCASLLAFPTAAGWTLKYSCGCRTGARPAGARRHSEVGPAIEHLSWVIGTPSDVIAVASQCHLHGRLPAALWSIYRLRNPLMSLITPRSFTAIHSNNKNIIPWGQQRTTTTTNQGAQLLLRQPSVTTIHRNFKLHVHIVALPRFLMIIFISFCAVLVWRCGKLAFPSIFLCFYNVYIVLYCFIVLLCVIFYVILLLHVIFLYLAAIIVTARNISIRSSKIIVDIANRKVCATSY